MGEINRGGHLHLDPKLRSGFFNLPDSSQHYGIGRDGHLDFSRRLGKIEEAGPGEKEQEVTL